MNRGVYREHVGAVLSALIRSFHVFMSILRIGLIVENILAAKKKFPRLTRFVRAKKLQVSALKILANAGHMSLYESNISEHISSYISNISELTVNMVPR